MWCLNFTLKGSRVINQKSSLIFCTFFPSTKTKTKIWENNPTRGICSKISIFSKRRDLMKYFFDLKTRNLSSWRQHQKNVSSSVESTKNKVEIPTNILTSVLVWVLNTSARQKFEIGFQLIRFVYPALILFL